jgi:hypothetical protein
MKVRYRQSGGFAGLVMGCDLDTEKMPPEEAGELTRLVKQAQIERVGTKQSSRGRDLSSYSISVAEGSRVTTARFDDMTVPAHAQPLLDFLKSRAKARPLDD